MRAAALLPVATLGFEVAARALMPRVATRGDWFDNVVDYKARQLAHMRRGRIPQLVVAGHSMTFDACEPARLSAALPGAPVVYNAGVNLAPLGLLSDWVTYVLEVAKPPRLVIGLTTVDLNRNGIEQAELLKRHRASRMGQRRGRPDFDAPEFGRSWSAELARNAKRIASNLRRARPAGLDKAQYLIGPDGRDFHKTGAPYRCSPGFQDRFRQKWLVDFSVGEEQIAGVEAMFRKAVSAGAETYFFMPPFTDDYVDLHPRGQEDVAEVVAVYRSIARSVTCRFLEAPRKAFDRSDFADPIHLNDVGMAKCTDWLAAQLRADGQG